MGFFQGFLSGFAETGSEILQRQDAEQQRIDEIVKRSDEQIRVNRAQIEDEAKAESERTKQQTEALASLYAAQGDMQPQGVLQMDNEPDVISGEVEAPSAFSGMTRTAATPSQVPAEYFSPYAGDADMVAKGLKDYRQDLRTEKQISSKMEIEQTKQASREKTKKLEIEAKKEADIASAWDTARNNKDSDVATTLQSAGTFPLVKEQIAQYRKASRTRNVDTALGAIVSGFLKNGTLSSKLLEEAGVSSAVVNAKDLKPVSNDEIKMLRAIAPSPDNVDTYNQFLFTILEYKAARASQKADFYIAAKEQELRPLDAELKYTKWEREYIKNNPYFAKISSGGMGFAPGVTSDVIANDDSWKTVLGLTPTYRLPNSTSPTGATATPSERGSMFDEYLKSTRQ